MTSLPSATTHGAAAVTPMWLPMLLILETLLLVLISGVKWLRKAAGDLDLSCRICWDSGHSATLASLQAS